ncbi:MAG: hypothetical protein A4E63_00165 [Syntrophorhabdus sp. PtaU1.Bin050]|nr:MAG: hypothetical protein A4E63_00165 [Syntrophorhabdus sp. PtaU1.Bin050]
MRDKKIAIISSLDTKGEAVNYLKSFILKRGFTPISVDVGYGSPVTITADITVDDIAKAAGSSAEEVRTLKVRQEMIDIVLKGAVAKLKELYASGGLDGVLAIGGMSNSQLAADVMQELPFTLPKLLMSTGASMPGSNKYFGPTGLTMMHSPIDIGALNSLLKTQLNRAGAAMTGMLENVTPPSDAPKDKPMVAICTYGYTEKCSQYLAKALNEKYETVNFHASGIPEVTMEKLIEDGLFDGVIDLVPSSITNALYGGGRTSWDRRLEVAAEKGVPQVVVPAGVHTFSRTGVTEEVLVPQLNGRKYYFMDAVRCSVFLTNEEVADVASVYARKLNKATGPVKFLVPLRGWISVEKETYNAEAIEGFVKSMRNQLKPEIELREVDANIDDPVFAQAVTQAFKEVMQLNKK